MKRTRLTLPSPKAALLVGCLLVGASTFLYGPDINPMGGLSYDIALFTAITLDTIIPGITEWQNPYLYYLVFVVAAMCLNMTLFFLPALAIVGVLRKRLRGMASFLVLSWLLFYLLAFLVLFRPDTFP